MKNFILFLITGIMVWVSVGCSQHHELSATDYVKWATSEDSGLIQEKRVGDYAFELRALPPELLVLRDHGPEAASQAEWPEWVAERSRAQYFQLRISTPDAQQPVLKHQVAGQGEYDERVKYFSFDMQRQLYLLQGQDTLKCKLFHFERSYDLAPFSNFLLAFEQDTTHGNQAFVYEDLALGVGPIRFRVPAIPNRKIQGASENSTLDF